jgi:dihydrofolate synthase/folylpolyglutamate synthase
LQAASQLQNELPFDGSAVKQALLEYSLPGRCECMPGIPEIWLDVAHNEQAIAVLVNALKESEKKPTHIVLGVLGDKDACKIIKKLSSVCCCWYFAEPRCSRAMSCEKLMAAASTKVVTASCYKSVLDAFNAAVQQVGQSGRVVVTGSFYTVSEVIAEHYAKRL